MITYRHVLEIEVVDDFVDGERLAPGLLLEALAAAVDAVAALPHGFQINDMQVATYKDESQPATIGSYNTTFIEETHPDAASRS